MDLKQGWTLFYGIVENNRRIHGMFQLSANARRVIASGGYFLHVKYSEGPSPHHYYVEHATLANGWDHQGEPEMLHRVELVGASGEWLPIHCHAIAARHQPDGS